VRKAKFGDDIESMATAPRDASDIILVTSDGEIIGHFAEGGGEEQPRFGPAFFRRSGSTFVEITAKLIGWKPLSHG
jgi:hypothetical protein